MKVSICFNGKIINKCWIFQSVLLIYLKVANSWVVFLNISVAHKVFILDQHVFTTWRICINDWWGQSESSSGIRFWGTLATNQWSELLRGEFTMWKPLNMLVKQITVPWSHIWHYLTRWPLCRLKCVPTQILNTEHEKNHKGSMGIGGFPP